MKREIQNRNTYKKIILHCNLKKIKKKKESHLNFLNNNSKETINIKICYS